MRGNLSVAASLSAAILLVLLLHAGSAFFGPLARLREAARELEGRP